MNFKSGFTDRLERRREGKEAPARKVPRAGPGRRPGRWPREMRPGRRSTRRARCAARSARPPAGRKGGQGSEREAEQEARAVKDAQDAADRRRARWPCKRSRKPPATRAMRRAKARGPRAKNSPRPRRRRRLDPRASDRAIVRGAGGLLHHSPVSDHQPWFPRRRSQRARAIARQRCLELRIYADELAAAAAAGREAVSHVPVRLGNPQCSRVGSSSSSVSTV